MTSRHYWIKMRKIKTAIILLLVIVLCATTYWYCKDTSISVEEVDKTTLSPTQIESIKSIGQWEFLSINDEEIVDTVRHGIFGDDELIRIYFGTLSLGIDMKDVEKDWIHTVEDTIYCTLPPVKLLDNNFIDEARTKAFFESGKWSGADRQTLYDRAYANMKQRCLSKNNIRAAESNAESQFYNMLRVMGFKNIRIKFDKK